MKVANVRDYGGVKRAEAAGVVYVGRPSALGNPFTVEAYGRDVAVKLYRKLLFERLKSGHAPTIAAFESLHEDSVLACWCRSGDPAPKGLETCHADIIANAWRWWVTQEKRR